MDEHGSSLCRLAGLYVRLLSRAGLAHNNVRPKLPPLASGFCLERLNHKVLTYVEYRAMSGVFQNIDPPTPSPPSVCVLPPHQRRGLVMSTISKRKDKSFDIEAVYRNESKTFWFGPLAFGTKAKHIDLV
jgi:hypothetical protein